MEKNVDLEIWWSSLPISEKERIARKGLSKAGQKEDDSLILYPGCTRWWQSLEEKRKESIYAHSGGEAQGVHLRPLRSQARR